MDDFEKDPGVAMARIEAALTQLRPVLDLLAAIIFTVESAEATPAMPSQVG